MDSHYKMMQDHAVMALGQPMGWSEYYRNYVEQSGHPNGDSEIWNRYREYLESWRGRIEQAKKNPLQTLTLIRLVERGSRELLATLPFKNANELKAEG